MRCPFCHNMNIVTASGSGPYTDKDILSFLTSRKGILDGVCITGGEPTLYKELPSFIGQIKDMGFSIKLDTNGTDPGMLGSLISSGLVDYVAMDIKSSLSFYSDACGIPKIDLSPIKESIAILKKGDCEYEFRTTAVSRFMNDDIVKDIGDLLNGADRYFLQGYVESEYVPDKSLQPVSKEKLLQYRQELSSYIKYVELRGID